MPVLYPDGPGICEHYAVQATTLKRRATPIGANDLWIACHALAMGATVVSHNVPGGGAATSGLGHLNPPCTASQGRC